MSLQEAWNFIGWLFAAGGIGVGTAFAAFKWFGERWFEQKFAKQLADLRHEHDKELENVKHTIQSMFSRISKVHEKEFEVLPKAWFLLHDACGFAAITVGDYRRIPDFLAMPEEKFDVFVKNTILSDDQQKELKELDRVSRMNYYLRATKVIGLVEMKDKHRVLNNYLIENRIFMTDELKNGFGAVASELLNGIISYEQGLRYGIADEETKGISTITALNSKMPSIEDAVQRRLQYNKA